MPLARYAIGKIIMAGPTPAAPSGYCHVCQRVLDQLRITVLVAGNGYRASKAALNQLSHTAAIELARYNPESCMVTLHPWHCRHRFIKAISKKRRKRTPIFSADHSASTTMASPWTIYVPAQTGGFFAYDGRSIPF